MRRLRAGWLYAVNPFGGQVERVDLGPGDVRAIVFWSKNYNPILPYLDQIDAMGYKCIFHYTITGLPSIFEPAVPELGCVVSAAKVLSDRYGADALLWRYDPIVPTSLTPASYHVSQFRDLAARLAGYTRRCYFSFTARYRKVLRNLNRLAASEQLEVLDLSLEEQHDLVERLAQFAGDHGITMHTCCQDTLISSNVRKGHCVDGRLIASLYPEMGLEPALRPTRDQCGCTVSTDIGAYDTCTHGCVYCYANTNKTASELRRASHNEDWPSLVLPTDASEDGLARCRPANRSDQLAFPEEGQLP